MLRTLSTCCAVLTITCLLAETPPACTQTNAPTATTHTEVPPTPEQEQQARAKAAVEAAADHADMMHQLGITSLRGGADGMHPAAPNHAIYDEGQVAPYTLPDPLVLANGQRVTTARMWWEQRRPQLVELLEAEMYGRLPAHTPGVTWTVLSATTALEGGVASTTRTLRGHVDNTAYPAISVDIEAELTLPAHTQGRVPVIVGLDWPPSFWAAMARRTGHAFPVPPGPTAKQQALAKGWGYALLVPTSVQADDGARMTSGIIGLCNHGGRRTPEQWGALRAWGWGASRLLDYFAGLPEVDVHRVGVFGHSRYGKAALVTMAFDPRFAAGYISSSGEVGAKLSRRTWGELVENITADEYYWMAGNFLKYGGPLTRNDLPVDAHDLIALCAPRAVYLSAGTQAAGDGWVDARGSFLAAVAAGPVYRLLGTQDLGTSTQPALLTEVGAGPLAFRQHDQGHTPAPNWPAFLAFAQREFRGPDFALNVKAQETKE